MFLVTAEAPTLADWIGAIGSLLAAVVAVILAFVAFRQMNAANAQADVAREQLRRWQQEERQRQEERDAEQARVLNEWWTRIRANRDERRVVREQVEAIGRLERQIGDLERAIRGEPREEAPDREISPLEQRQRPPIL